MRKLTKAKEPSVLSENRQKWLNDLKVDRTSAYRRHRYRHPDIKSALCSETGHKCVYCESKIGHNTPGDIEHKIPTSKDVDSHFKWENLTIACTECNRRKNDYYEAHEGFLDPYIDDVEAMLIHHGPVVSWAPGHRRAEITVKILGLFGPERLQLFFRKLEKLQQVADLLERHNEVSDQALRMVLQQQLTAMRDSSEEYSAMVASYIEQHAP